MFTFLAQAWQSFIMQADPQGLVLLKGEAFEEKSQSKKILSSIHDEFAALIPNPTVFTSLTHSAGLIIAIGYAAQVMRVSGVGIDVERSNRVIRNLVFKRVVHLSEQGWKLPFLDYWVVKEACLKANPNSLGTTVPHYRMTSFIPSSRGGEGEAVFKQTRFRFQLIHLEGWTLCFAYSLVRDLCYENNVSRYAK